MRFFVFISCKLFVFFLHNERELLCAAMNIEVRALNHIKSLFLYLYCIFYFLDFSFSSPMTTIFYCISFSNN